MGVDGISPRVLKGCATALLEPLTYLFQLCLNSSSIPDEWKIHKIKPLPKKGDLTLPCNYRPISLLCIVSKIMESIVYKKIIDFMVNKKQFGFLAGRSCVQQLLRCFDEIFDNADLGSPTDVVYLDLRKAFDSVPHDSYCLSCGVWALLVISGNGSRLIWCTVNTLSLYSMRIHLCSLCYLAFLREVFLGLFFS